MPLQSQPEPASEIVHLVVSPNGEVASNDQNLPLKHILAQASWPTALRLAFDRQGNTLYVQDGQEWHGPISGGEESAWTLLNSSLRHIRQAFGAQPGLRFGEPPGTVEKKALSEFPAWFRIQQYVWGELGTRAHDLPVVEYVPAGPTARTAFLDMSGHAENVVLGTPGIFVNRNMGPYGQPDYEKVNKLLFEQYISHLAELHPQEFEKQIRPEHEVYFAIREKSDPMEPGDKGKTKLFRAKPDQQGRMVDEESLKKEPKLQGKEDPIVLFHFLPESKRIILLNQDRRTMRRYETTSQMLDDIKRILAKKMHVSEQDIIVSHNDMAASPFVSKTSNYSFVEYFLDSVVGARHPSLPVVECPLTTKGDIVAHLVASVADEETKVTEERRQRIKHGVILHYPFIAVDSRVQSRGTKSREIVIEYAKMYPDIVDKDPTGCLFDNDREIESRLGRADVEKYLKEFARFMLEMSESPRSIIDFFAPREKPNRRALLMDFLTPIFQEYEKDKDQRRTGMEKTAGLDIGINEWQKYGLQEQLNVTQHQNEGQHLTDNKKPQVMPFNLKLRRQKSSPAMMEMLLTKDHDKEQNYMKTMEQLLKESRI